MAVRKFERGSSTYNCNVCKRLTRNTGDEGNSKLCSDCYELAGIANEISDNGGLKFTSETTVLDHLRMLKSRGIDLHATWGDEFAEFIPKV